MTREEAIEQLQKCKELIEQNVHEHLDEKDFPLVDMAVEALSKVDTTENPKCDLISRADAIEAVTKKLQDWGSYAFEDYRRGLYEAQDIIEALPSAEAVPNSEWVRSYLKNDMWHCTECGAPIITDDISEMNYCPNCGARMKGGAE